MSDERIKDLPDIVPVDTTLVPGDSTGTGTGKATIRAWTLAGLAWALSQLANAAVAAQGVWTFANNVVLSQGLAVAGALTAAFGIDLGSHKATSMLDPTAAQDGATKAYVDKNGIVTVSAVVTTTDATPTIALTITPAADTATQYRVRAVYGTTAATDAGSASASVGVLKHSGTASAGTPYATGIDNSGGITAAVVMLTSSGGNFVVTVTGVAGKTIRWYVVVEAITVTLIP